MLPSAAKAAASADTAKAVSDPRRTIRLAIRGPPPLPAFPLPPKPVEAVSVLPPVLSQRPSRSPPFGSRACPSHGPVPHGPLDGDCDADQEGRAPVRDGSVSVTKVTCVAAVIVQKANKSPRARPEREAGRGTLLGGICSGSRVASRDLRRSAVTNKPREAPNSRDTRNGARPHASLARQRGSCTIYRLRPSALEFTDGFVCQLGKPSGAS